jgi:hypothetical protein
MWTCALAVTVAIANQDQNLEILAAMAETITTAVPPFSIKNR